MGKKAKARRQAATRSRLTGPPLRTSPNWPLFVLSLAGMLLSGYLAWTALGGDHVKGCSAGSACDIVLSSHWAKLLGLPTALWGFFAYTALAGIAFVARVDRHWQYAWIVSFFSFVFSVYLTTVSLTILNAACPYCLTSLALATAIFVLVTFQRPSTLPTFSWPKWLTRTVPVAAALILVLHLNYTGAIGGGPAPEDAVATALADHLKQSGVRFFGAFWCPHCQDQKILFGSAASRLPYIECSPDGQGTPQAGVCRAENIESYPTWIIDGKRYEKVMTLAELANATNFKAPASPAN
jgi:uncharacterized membrane protein